MASEDLNLPDHNPVTSSSEEALFFNLSLDLLAIASTDGYFRRVNPAWTRTLGYSEAELTAQSFMEFVHPDDRASTLAELEQLKVGTPTLSFENRYRAKDGTYRLLSWTASPQVERGELFCVARDVTQQKATEAALQTANETLEQRVAERTTELQQANQRLHESERLFRAAIDHIPDVFVIYDAERRIQFINAAGLTLTGRPLEDFVGYRDEDVQPPEVTEVYLPLLRRAVETKHYQTGECTIALPHREPYTIVVQYVPLLDEQGENRQILGITYDITERKQAEELVRQSEQQMRRVLDSLYSFVGVMTPDGTLIEANRTALAAADLQSADVLGRPFADAFWWSYDADVQAQLRRAIAQAAQGATIRYDAVVRVRDHHLITIDFTIVPLFDAAGQVEYLIPSGIDISDRKQTELALLESQLQIQRQLAEIETIYQSAPIGLNVLDRDLRFVRINERLAEINGFSVAEHIGCTVRELLPALADTAENLLRPVFETGDPLLNIEIRGETPAQPGVERVWLESFLPLMEGDRVIGINTVCEEITDRIQAEAALRESAAQFRQMADHAPVMVWVTDPTGYCTFLSQSWYDFTGQTEAEGLGFGWLDATHPDDFHEAQAAFIAANTHQTAFRLEYRLRRQDGEYRWALDAASPWFGAEGEFKGYIGSVIDITDRKQAEADLQQNATRLEFVLNSAQLGIWEVNLQSNSFIAEPRSLRHDQIYGYDSQRSEWDYDTFIAHIHPDDRAWVGASFQQTLSEFADWNIECRIIRADGALRWVWIRGGVYRDDHDRPSRLIGLIADISERKWAEQRLSESEERLRLGMQVTGFALMKIDYHADQVSLSPEAALLYGLAEDELVISRERLHAAFHPDDRTWLLPLIEQVIDPSGAGWFALDHRVMGADGAVRWLTVRKQVFFEEVNGVSRANHAVLVALDITERKQAEAALSRSEERYRTLFETMEDGFCILQILFDADQSPIDYCFLEANPAFEQQTGLRDPVGHTARQLIPDLEDYWFETYGNVALTREPLRFEQGSEVMNRWFEVYAFPIGAPEEYKVALLFKNVSDRKAIETQRERLLQQEQTAREAAERANRMKDEFLAVLSHELRTPLNPILGWAKILQSPRVDSQRLQQGLQIIERNAQQQTQLISDLLDVSRIIRGQLSLDLKVIDPTEPVLNALDTVQFSAEAKGIEMQVSLDRAIAPIQGDEGRLQQVVWNLLSNAIKFTPTAGRVTVSLTQTQDAVQIQVSDTGQGIEPDFLPQVFTLFKQQDSSITRSFGGLGLGLAIVKQVVEAHGGTITAASAGVGQGATFTVRLPLMRAWEVESPDGNNSEALALKNSRIIIVDDEDDSLELLKVILEQQGAVICPFSSPETALQALAQSSFDLLISDIGMPNIDGYELITEIRTESPLNRAIPAIALTAFAGESNQKRAIAAGYQAHVAKPVNPSELLEVSSRLVTPDSSRGEE